VATRMGPFSPCGGYSKREPLYLVQMALFLAYLMEIARSAEPMNMSKT